MVIFVAKGYRTSFFHYASFFYLFATLRYEAKS